MRLALASEKSANAPGAEIYSNVVCTRGSKSQQA